MFEFTVTVSYLRLAAALLLGFAVVGPGYAWLLNQPRTEWLASRATELSVLIGVGLTLGLLLIIFPLIAVLLVLLLFASTGFWQFIRSGYNRHVRKPSQAAAEKAEVAALARETLARVPQANGLKERVP